MAFSWKIWANKLAVNAGIVLVAGLVSVYGNDPKYLGLIVVAKALENWLKHR